MSSSKEDQWNKAHAATKNDNNIPSRLYTDENPVVTFRRLCQSTANKHSYGKEPTKEELKRAREDLLDGQRLLIELLTCRTKMSSKLFPLTSFVALFGGPGIHGYGSHSIDSEEFVSKVIINGMDGIGELIGATKASKLMIDNVIKVEVTYNSVDESCMATIIRSTQSNTLENLWERASADSCRSNLSSGRKKRQRDDKVHTKEEGIKLSEEWTCNACTFIHIGISKRDFLACELCGSTRTECPDNI